MHKKEMKGYYQNHQKSSSSSSSPLNKLSKLSNTLQIHLFNTLTYFIIFGCGLTLGIILTTYAKDLSLDLRLSQTKLAPSLSPANNDTIAPENKNKNNTDPAAGDDVPRVGLKEYLKPPSVWHDMTDGELLWRASTAPRVATYPYDRVPKVAFMFLVRGHVFMSPLWQRFFQGHEGLFTIYVHSNPSYNGSLPESPVFHGRRIPSKEVGWGKVNMIEAERRLLANALLDQSNERFVLLSEACIPLYNFKTVYNYLINSTKSHVMSNDEDSAVGRGRYNHKMYPQISLKQWRKGSQWFEMNRDLAIEVVSDTKYFPIFQKYCTGSCYADEHYLPTLVNIKFREKNSNRSLTWVDWSKGGPHPTRFWRTDVTVDLLRGLRTNNTDCVYNDNINTTNVCFLFARKFLPSTVERLVKFAPKIMHFHK